MSLAEGKALLAAAQQHLVNGQCQGIACALRAVRMPDWASRDGTNARSERSLVWSTYKALGFDIVGARGGRQGHLSVHSLRWFPLA